MTSEQAGNEQLEALLAPPLLPCEQHLVGELAVEDALCIMASGLAWQKVLAALLRLQGASADGVVIIIGANPAQRQLLCAELLRQAPGAAAPLDVTADVPTADRLAHYQAGRAAFVTTRILVVDLLSGRLQPSAIAGLVVLNAHRAADQTGEGFAGGCACRWCAATPPERHTSEVPVGACDMPAPPRCSPAPCPGCVQCACTGRATRRAGCGPSATSPRCARRGSARCGQHYPAAPAAAAPPAGAAHAKHLCFTGGMLHVRADGQRPTLPSRRDGRCAAAASPWPPGHAPPRRCPLPAHMPRHSSLYPRSWRRP